MSWALALGVLRDLAFGVRTARRAPGYAALTVLTLALAVGANVAVFTLVNAIWLRPRPVGEPDRLVIISDLPVHGEAINDLLHTQHFEQLRRLPVFEGLAAQVNIGGLMSNFRPLLVFSDVGSLVETLPVSAEYFQVLRVPVAGRAFAADDDQPGAAPVAIISHRLWTSRFGARRDVIGGTVSTSHGPVTIVGVAAEGFHGARLGEGFDVWLPRNLLPRVAGVAGAPDAADIVMRLLPHMLVARLPAGVSVADARRAVEAEALASKARVVVHPLSDIYGRADRPTILINEAGILRVVWFTAGLVLLAGCATLAALVMVHYERRRAELAIRLALGCSRRRLVGQLVAELVVLVIAGAALAVLIASWSLASTTTLSLPSGIDLSRLDLRIDWRVLGAAAAMSLATMVLASLVPLARFTRPALAATATAAATTSSAASIRFRQAMLALHVTATVVVLIAAGLFVRTVVHGFNRGPGFNVSRTLTVHVQPGLLEFYDAAEGDDQAGSAGRERAAYARLVADLRALPGVTSVVHGYLPIEPSQAVAPTPRPIVTDGQEHNIRVGFQPVGPGWIDVVGLALLAGRDFAGPPGDPAVTPAIVTQSLARSLWANTSPLGRRFSLPPPLARRSNRPSPIYEVIGVVSDFQQGSLRFPALSGFLVASEFTGFMSSGSSGTSVTVGTGVDAGSLAHAVRTVAGRVFPRAARLDVDTGAELVARDLGRERLGAWFFTGFGLVSLGLGLAGVFGLVAYLAESRRREIGVRMALGATPGRLMRSMAVPGIVTVAVGTVCGLVAAVLLARTVEGFMHGISPLDPVTYVGVGLLMIASAIGAGLAAALRIRRVSPMEALRAE